VVVTVLVTGLAGGRGTCGAGSVSGLGWWFEVAREGTCPVCYRQVKLTSAGVVKKHSTTTYDNQSRTVRIPCRGVGWTVK
jgi:hypothetical protein